MLKSFLANPTMASIVTGQLRHLGTAAGAVLASRGLIDGGQVELVAGVVVTIGSMVLSALAKRA